MNILEYSKLILSRVSYYPEIFKRELQKSIDSLDNEDNCILRIWCIKEFGKDYPEIQIESFQFIPNQNVRNRNNLA